MSGAGIIEREVMIVDKNSIDVQTTKQQIIVDQTDIVFLRNILKSYCQTEDAGLVEDSYLSIFDWMLRASLQATHGDDWQAEYDRVIEQSPYETLHRYHSVQSGKEK